MRCHYLEVGFHIELLNHLLSNNGRHGGCRATTALNLFLGPFHRAPVKSEQRPRDAATKRPVVLVLRECAGRRHN